MNFLQKHTLLISCIAMFISWFTLFTSNNLNKEDYSISRPAVYKVLLDNYDKPDGFLKNVEHPNWSSSGGVEKILNESMFYSEVVFSLNSNQKYSYKVKVAGKYGLPLILGFNEVTSVELLSIE